ncbi:inactive CLIP domain-containing serine protease A8-like [Anopheles nili]|uniref:inactive CLIP domain-containing serine protease A8-like n=1 Tax=Anopheles nili TaxID=185578 RepID=UPI00237B0D94|nr:inactive CLIP domain-containing serine protease A8-like [Anopheles nili]
MGKYIEAAKQQDVRVAVRLEEPSECDDPLQVCCDIDTSRKNLTSEAVSIEPACGIRNSMGLVYNVESNLTYAKYGEFPWTVAIFALVVEPNQVRLELAGGGSLIHPKFVLTSAYTKQEPHKFIARLGEWDLRTEAEKYASQDIEIQEHLIHPNYRAADLPENDIAVAVLKRPVEYSAHIRPICLPQRSDVFDGKRCIATGWGKDVRTKNYAPVMKSIEMPVVPRKRCKVLLRVATANSNFELFDYTICAGGVVDEDTCDKDGGSPLACPTDDGSYVLAGIVSWGASCGLADTPGVYVNVAKYVPWINQKIGEYEEMQTDY